MLLAKYPILTSAIHDAFNSNFHNGVKKEVATDHETSIIHTQRTVSGPNEYHQIKNPGNILKCENNFEKIDRDHIIREL